MNTCDRCPCDEFSDEKFFHCLLLGRKMYRRQAELCRTRPAYRLAWDLGRGPGQHRSTPPSIPLAPAVIAAAERLADELNDPSLAEKARHYAGALARWTRAGFPVRTVEEVAEIHTSMTALH
jgi:hypothetical protein